MEPSQTYVLDDIKILIREAYKQSEESKKDAFLKRAKSLEQQLILTYNMQGQKEFAKEIPHLIAEFESQLKDK